jgi:hypothetical protein
MTKQPAILRPRRVRKKATASGWLFPAIHRGQRTPIPITGAITALPNRLGNGLDDITAVMAISVPRRAS